MPHAETPSVRPYPPFRSVQGLALFLDLDGVLAAIEKTPEAVGPDARRNAVLARLAEAAEGRVAVLSGRTVADVDRILERAIPTVAGVHGLERRDAEGATDFLPADTAMPSVLKTLNEFAAERDGVLIEDKGPAIALHYRLAPTAEQASMDLARSLADDNGLVLQPGQCVIEIKTPGADKGVALTEIMARAPFAGATPVMLGDDLTDEFAFRAAQKLGGAGIFVGPSEHLTRPTDAQYALSGPQAVLDWLNSLTEMQ